MAAAPSRRARRAAARRNRRGRRSLLTTGQRTERAALVAGAGALVAASGTAAVVARGLRSRRARSQDASGFGQHEPTAAADRPRPRRRSSGAATARPPVTHRPALPGAEHLTVPTADGAELAVTVAGPSDGPAVVLSHCWTGSRAVWAGVAERLVGDGHRVVLYDQRGHGESPAHHARPTIPSLGHDLRTVLEATEARDAVLVGHSMGGMTIQSYVAEHPDDFAERARAVVLVATAARTLGRSVPERAVHAVLGEGGAWLRRGRVGHRVVRGSLGRVADPAHVALTLDLFAGTPAAARAGYLLAMASMDLRPALPRITVPSTVLVGTRDTLTPPRRARLLAEHLPDAELVVLPGRGHMLPLEAPDDVVAAVHRTAARAGVRQPSPT